MKWKGLTVTLLSLALLLIPKHALSQTEDPPIYADDTTNFVSLKTYVVLYDYKSLYPKNIYMKHPDNGEYIIFGVVPWDEKWGNQMFGAHIVSGAPWVNIGQRGYPLQRSEVEYNETFYEQMLIAIHTFSDDLIVDTIKWYLDGYPDPAPTVTNTPEPTPTFTKTVTNTPEPTQTATKAVTNTPNPTLKPTFTPTLTQTPVPLVAEEDETPWFIEFLNNLLGSELFKRILGFLGLILLGLSIVILLLKPRMGRNV